MTLDRLVKEAASDGRFKALIVVRASNGWLIEAQWAERGEWDAAQGPDLAECLRHALTPPKTTEVDLFA